MSTEILNWYAYAQTGDAARRAGAADDEPANPSTPARPLADPRRVVELFADARALDAEVDDRDWKFLWPRRELAERACPELVERACRELVERAGRELVERNHFGLERLIDLARKSGWRGPARDDEVAEALVEQSLCGGYDPVSGLFGAYDRDVQAFELQEFAAMT